MVTDVPHITWHAQQLQSCSLNKFFISVTLILSIVVSIIAILPWVQKGEPVHVHHYRFVRVCVSVHLSCHGRSQEVIRPQAGFCYVPGYLEAKAMKSGSMWAPAVAQATDENISVLKELVRQH